MKFLPDQPPVSVPGVIAQRGRAGPFLRGGRLPIDPRSPAQLNVRARFSYATKSYRFGSPTYRSDWDAAFAPGGSGSAKIAGVGAASAFDGGSFPTPLATPPTPPSFLILDWEIESGSFMVVQTAAVEAPMTLRAVLGKATVGELDPPTAETVQFPLNPDGVAESVEQYYLARWPWPVSDEWVSIRVMAYQAGVLIFSETFANAVV